MRPDWHAIFRYEPDGTIWWRENSCNKRRIMHRPAGHLCGGLRNEGYFYLKVSFKGKWYSAHRIIWEMHYGTVTPGMKIDHADNDTSNNRIENLQELTNADNTKKQKKRKNNTTGFKGVILRKRTGRFEARICLKGKDKYLGSYLTKTEAHEAYKIAALHYFGQKLARFE